MPTDSSVKDKEARIGWPLVLVSGVKNSKRALLSSWCFYGIVSCPSWVCWIKEDPQVFTLPTSFFTMRVASVDSSRKLLALDRNGAFIQVCSIKSSNTALNRPTFAESCVDMCWCFCCLYSPSLLADVFTFNLHKLSVFKRFSQTPF